MEQVKTVEEALEKLKALKDTPGNNVLVEVIDVLANEIQSIKKELVKHKLLIEHEERLRTFKYKEQRKTERNVNRKFKRGDVVCRIKDLNKSGQIITVKNDRAQVLFDETPCWVALRSLTYYQVAA